MDDKPTEPKVTSFYQGSNVHSIAPDRAPEVGDSSKTKYTQTCEISYNQIRAIHPINC